MYQYFVNINNSPETTPDEANTAIGYEKFSSKL